MQSVHKEITRLSPLIWCLESCSEFHEQDEWTSIQSEVGQTDPTSLLTRLRNLEQKIKGIDPWSQPRGTSILIRRSTKPTGFVLCVDFDDTLVQSVSGKKFRLDSKDWALKYDPLRLKDYHESGWTIVILTNQATMKGTRDTKITDRIDQVINHLGIPVWCVIAMDKDSFRKPRTGMVDYLVEREGFPKASGGQYLMVGDAAGRPGDHAASDRRFAENLGIPFRTPEQFFLSADTPLPPDPHPLDSVEYGEYQDIQHLIPKGSVILMRGPPGSGKTTWTQTQSDVVVVSGDKEKTADRCLKKLISHFPSGKTVIVDRTFPSVESRAKFVQLAHERGREVYLVEMAVPIELAKYLATYRESTGGPHIPSLVYNKYKSESEPGTKAEGFKKIYKIVFCMTSEIPRLWFE